MSGDGINTEKPTVRVRSWKEMVLRRWGPEYNESDDCYEFSNRRKFKSSDRGTSGVYRKD